MPIQLILCFLISFAAYAKSKDETNIVCFAAKNKWVCAPEDRQELANEKAKKLLEKSNKPTQNIKIKPLTIPSFIPIAQEEQIPLQIKSSKPVAKKDNSTYSESYNLKKPIDYQKYWSYQLIGVSTLQNAKNFIQQKKLNASKLIIIESTRKGMPWWVVLFGLFEDKAIAQENLNKLPQGLKNTWLRSLKELAIVKIVDLTSQ